MSTCRRVLPSALLESRPLCVTASITDEPSRSSTACRTDAGSAFHSSRRLLAGVNPDEIGDGLEMGNKIEGMQAG